MKELISPETSISFALLMSITSIVCTIVTTALNTRKQRKEEQNERLKNQEARLKEQLDLEKNFVKINFKLDDFCDTTKKILKDHEKVSESVVEIHKELVHQNDVLENHEKRITTLEKK